MSDVVSKPHPDPYWEQRDLLLEGILGFKNVSFIFGRGHCV